jgi:hypothetical protein
MWRKICAHQTTHNPTQMKQCCLNMFINISCSLNLHMCPCYVSSWINQLHKWGWHVRVMSNWTICTSWEVRTLINNWIIFLKQLLVIVEKSPKKIIPKTLYVSKNAITNMTIFFFWILCKLLKCFKVTLNVVHIW